MKIDTIHIIACAAAIAAAGCTSEVGPAGPMGTLGEMGTMGVDGTQGPTGPAGLAGSMGSEGSEGPEGPEGAVGPEGPEGPTWQVVVPWLRGEYQANAAKWWEWANSLPAAGHPLDYASPGDCSLGQEGSVFYLGGSFGGADVPAGCDPSAGTCTGTAATVVRDCTIPEGRAIFFPLVNLQYTNVDESPLLTHEELMTNARALGTAATSLSATIDGIPVPNIEDFHVQTGVYEYGLVAGAPNGPSSGAADFTQASEDSYYVMLSPLSPGTHTIRFTGAYHFNATDHGFDWTFDLDVTYNITVAAAGS